MFRGTEEQCVSSGSPAAVCMEHPRRSDEAADTSVGIVCHRGTRASPADVVVEVFILASGDTRRLIDLE